MIRDSRHIITVNVILQQKFQQLIHLRRTVAVNAVAALIPVCKGTRMVPSEMTIRTDSHKNHIHAANLLYRRIKAVHGFIPQSMNSLFRDTGCLKEF